jgi:pyruvate ferredoxin oxidoreductase gamma subunit
MYDSLLTEAVGSVFQEVTDLTPVFVNGDSAHASVELADLPPARLSFVDLSAIARRNTGSPFVSAASAAVAAKCIPAVRPDALTEAVKTELVEFGLTPDLIEKNAAAARQAYEATVAAELVRAGAPPVLGVADQAISYPPGLALVGPTIRSRGNASLRATGSWRVEQPVIDPARCKRCFVCYLYCPEAAVRLDGQNFPHIDYDHCKGCMICYEECPTDAISRKLEA